MAAWRSERLGEACETFYKKLPETTGVCPSGNVMAKPSSEQEPVQTSPKTPKKPLSLLHGNVLAKGE